MTSGKLTETKTGESFLSRWARVKLDGEKNGAADHASPAVPDNADIESQNTSIDAPLQHKSAEDARPERTLPASKLPSALPSLESLTAESDFAPFMAKDVDPQLRNLAMKKLFTDPHYNVMDRLDTYIDDYSIESPLSIEVIRQMSISKTLRLFDDEDESEKAKGIAESEAPLVLPPNPAVPATPTIEVPARPETAPDAQDASKPAIK